MIGWLKEKAQNLSDGTLTKKTQEGDTDQFGQLYLKYVDGIFRYIFFKVNCDKMIAEDLTEITFQKALKNMNRFDSGKGTFKAWLFRIAHNSVIDFYRQAGREGKLSENLANSENLEEDFDKKIESEKIQNALVTLTSEQRSVVSMRFIEEMNHREIAHVLGKKEEAVRAIQYRALKTLRGNLA